MSGGWLVGVMVAGDGGPMLRHYYAVGHPDQGKAEWTAMDWALRDGEVATSPVAGAEPVAAIRQLTPQKMAALGLRTGEVRPLGWKHPRRWLS